MDTPNCGTEADYDKNATEADNSISLDRLIKGEKILVEHILKKEKGQLKYTLKIYSKANEYDASDEYHPLHQYTASLKDYEEVRLDDIMDMGRFFPIKNFFKEPLPAGFFGYTIRGYGFFVRNENLIPGEAQAYKTDVHELIHTSDEHETRVLTEWILDKDVNKYMFNKGVVMKNKERYVN